MPTPWVVAGATAAGAGAWIGSWVGGYALVLTAATVLAVAAAAVSWPRSRPVLLAGVVAIGLGAAADAAWRTDALASRVLPQLASAEATVEACGNVVGRRPRSLMLDARSAATRDGRWRIREPLRVSGTETDDAPVGARLCARGRVIPPRPGRDPSPLLAADAYRTDGTGAPIRGAADAVRRRFTEAARRALPDRQAGLLLGMTDGDTALLDDATMESFRTTGLAHLVAVSGSNVAVVLAAVLLAARAIVPRSRGLRAAIAIPPLVAFAFLTALEASVLRAVVTAGVVVVVTAGGRRADGIRAAAAAFILLVLASPELVRSVGFQLSFAATIGLLLWAGPLTERFCGFLRILPERAGLAVAAVVGTTLAAQLAVAPLLAVHFGQVPALGGLANLLVAPLAPVVMVGGMVSLTAASLTSALEWAPATLRLLLDAILWTADRGAEVPAASIAVDAAAGLGLLGVLVAVADRHRLRRRVAAACAVALCAASLGHAHGAAPPRCPGAEVRALDVGQGTAVLLRHRSHAVLVDAGPDDAVLQELDEAGVHRLDALFLSHPHADHVRGAVPLLPKVDVDLLAGPVTMGWGTGAETLRAAAEAKVPTRVMSAGDEVRYPGLSVEVLSPEAGPANPDDEDAVNAFSLVLRAELGGVSVILPGDVTARDQSRLLGLPLRADILVAPHHGSADLEPDFVDAVRPKATLVTVGGDNRYGHPSAGALAMFGNHGSVLRTDTHGTVVVCADGRGSSIVTERSEAG